MKSNSPVIFRISDQISKSTDPMKNLFFALCMAHVMTRNANEYVSGWEIMLSKATIQAIHAHCTKYNWIMPGYANFGADDLDLSVDVLHVLDRRRKKYFQKTPSQHGLLLDGNRIKCSPFVISIDRVHLFGYSFF